MVKKKQSLGKGLGALIEEKAKDIPENIEQNEKNIINIDINEIQPDENQPRKTFDDKTIDELAKSIQNVGVISPIIVKKVGNFYQIISGERRFRAVKKIKQKTIPAIVREYDKLELLQVSLIENIQREDLNPIEEAKTYKILKDEFDLSHDEIANRVGKNRATISNMIRLLNLDHRVQIFLTELKLTQGHARAILSIPNGDMQFEIAETIIEDGLSVRQVEELTQQILNKDDKEENEKPQKDNQKEAIYIDISKKINQILGTKVNIKDKNNKGKIEIEYYSQDDLDRIFTLLKKIDGGY